MKVAVLMELEKKHKDAIEKCGVGVSGVDFDADIALVQNSFDNFSRYRKLKWIHSTFTGVDKLLTDEVKKSGVIITTSAGINTAAIAEHAVAYMLMFEHRMNRAVINQQNRKWVQFDDVGALQGRTIGILGLGRIGAKTAELCKAFGCRVVAITHNGSSCKYADKIYHPRQLSSLLGESDYVVVCLPLTKETTHIIGKKEFAAMKKSGILINIGRGAIVDENALVAALESGKIAGAGLDVFEKEPLPPASKLWETGNVIITAHYSGRIADYVDKAVEIFCENLAAFLKGRKMKNVVDKEKGY